VSTERGPRPDARWRRTRCNERPGTHHLRREVDLYLPAADSQTYVLIEHYPDADAVKADGKDPNTQAMATTIKDLLDGPPAAERLILVSSKP
jgi:quinol monooxygenase YgiN